jgi:hypothetical protein
MNSSTLRILTTIIILSTTMATNVAGQNAEGEKPKYKREGNYDWKKMMTIADRKRDAVGMLLPLQSDGKRGVALGIVAELFRSG